MLAGRKLLLADDSITIQKVVALTFADEGVEVVAVSNGAQAIEKLEDFIPDVVLADVFMPHKTGYEVCEYIKENERLQRIPVMLLVGSFEPFDEAEARRVGADDILSKPFQSIRSLIDKVGALMGRGTGVDPAKQKSQAVAIETAPPELDGAETLDMPHETLAPGGPAAAEILSSDEIELTTADTQKLTPEILASSQPEVHPPIQVPSPRQMETSTPKPRTEMAEGFGETLLDLSHVQAEPLLSSDDAILDIDFDEPALAAGAAASKTATSVAVAATIPEHEFAWVPPSREAVEWQDERDTGELTAPPYLPDKEPVYGTSGEELGAGADTVVDYAPEQFVGAPEVIHEPPPATVSQNAAAAPTGQITPDQLSRETIDAIAHRVVEQLSERAVQEIAWEVVPQLAELLIKRQLEEKAAKTN